MRTARVKLHNWEAHDRERKRILTSALGREVPQYVIKYLKWLLAHRQQADGSQMPKKAPSTVKAYKRKGYDTTHFLIASGESTRLAFSLHNNGTIVRIEPRRPDILAFNSPDRALWTELDEKAQQDVFDILANALEKGLK